MDAHVMIRMATQAWEREGAMQLRRDVFCTEQRLFAFDDRDAFDAIAHTIVAVSLVTRIGERVAGTVRIHETAPRRWTGSRLAIRREYRRVGGLGAGLVRRAVGTAIGRGCDEFLAMVQAQNVSFFRRLHWEALEEREAQGYPHILMRADLDAYAPYVEGSTDAPLTVRLAS